MLIIARFVQISTTFTAMQGQNWTYGRKRVITPNNVYPIEETAIIVSPCAFAISNALRGKFPRIMRTGSFPRILPC
jgi:hypothetical protein